MNPGLGPASSQQPAESGRPFRVRGLSHPTTQPLDVPHFLGNYPKRFLVAARSDGHDRRRGAADATHEGGQGRAADPRLSDDDRASMATSLMSGTRRRADHPDMPTPPGRSRAVTSAAPRSNHGCASDEHPGEGEAPMIRRPRPHRREHLLLQVEDRVSEVHHRSRASAYDARRILEEVRTRCMRWRGTQARPVCNGGR